MKLQLHHVNVCSDNVEELLTFYRDALGLEMAELPPMIEDLASQNERTASEDDGKWSQNVGFFDASGQDELQIHATRRQTYLGPRMGHTVNPLVNGHFAFRTDDLDAVRKQLDEAGVPYSDWGVWSVDKWDQIFLTDPAGNVIEIHQILD